MLASAIRNVFIGIPILGYPYHCKDTAPLTSIHSMPVMLSQDERSREAGEGGRSRRIPTVPPTPCRYKAFQRGFCIRTLKCLVHWSIDIAVDCEG